MMSEGKKSLVEKIDFTHLISIGFLSMVVPRQLVENVLEQLDRSSKRVRLLPASAVVYFVMAMSLYRDPPLDEILRIFAEPLRTLSLDRASSILIPNKSAISHARSRLGSEPMRLIADRVMKPFATPDFPGAWYRGMRLMSIDGSCFNIPDEKQNADFFGYPSASRGEPAFPQARVVSLVETGTRAAVAVEIGSYKTSEHALTRAIIERGKITREMLVLADRNFAGYPLWSQAASTGANLLWRAKVKQPFLPILKRLPDGSYLSHLGSSQRKSEPILEVRVIEYGLTDKSLPSGSDQAGVERYRLVTNILDHELAPANELADLYHERWEIETLYGEFKKYLHKASPVLRSKTPELALQELWGLVLVHYALKVLLAESAYGVGLDPDRLSFTNALHVIRRKLPRVAAFPPREDWDLVFGR